MSNCLLPSCGKELIQTPGKKAKKYCDAKCKQKHWQQLQKDNSGEHSQVKKLLEYCKEKGITVDELIEHHKKFAFKNSLTIPVSFEYTVTNDKKESKTDKHLPGLTAGFKHTKVQAKKVDMKTQHEASEPVYKPWENARFKAKNNIK